MNDYDEEALVARSRCNHTLGRNEEAIEDGKLLKIFQRSRLEYFIAILTRSAGWSGQEQGVNFCNRGFRQGGDIL